MAAAAYRGIFSEGMRKSSLCTTRLPHLGLCVDSLHFPSEFLEEHAEELGVIERDRKLQIPAFVWAFVFGFRRSYNSTADETISPGGFYQRLTPELAAYFHDLVEHGLDEVAVPDAVDADIDRFRDVMIADGTVLRLHEFFSEEFRTRKEEQAGAKLHLLHNATDQTIE